MAGQKNSRGENQKRKEQQAAAVTLKRKVEHPSLGHSHLVAGRAEERPHGEPRHPRCDGAAARLRRRARTYIAAAKRGHLAFHRE